MVEMVSMIASVIILVANGVKSITLMRVLFLTSCIMFIGYGIIIGSPSLVFLNSCSTVIHIYKLIQIYNEQKARNSMIDAFKLW